MIDIPITLSADKYLPKYAKWLEEFGFKAWRIEKKEDAEEAPFIVLSGGGDLGIETSAYTCNNPEERISGVKKNRDELEFDLLHFAIERDIPVLGVCRGFQVMNVFLGGTLWPDIENGNFDLSKHRGNKKKEGSDVVHIVNSRKGNFHVTSHHHQGIKTLGEGLLPTGYSEDGLIEAFVSGDNLWNGVQWHPERTESGRGRRWFEDWLESIINQ